MPSLNPRNGFDIRSVKFIASAFYRKIPSLCWIPCTVAITELDNAQFGVFIVDGFDQRRSYKSAFKTSWRTHAIQDSRLLVWFDGTEEYQVVLNEGGPNFTGLVLAFMLGLHLAYHAWQVNEDQLLATLQALPADLSAPWPGVTVTRDGTLEAADEPMDID
ncbi:uncharacterized protein B0H18DRAFT_1125448 [Fomitopsis serialis]|uniref:uncharacterized protein n=1 Tax=Fomitopsis serialis TaxID=139415 RepID=UPI0020088B8F|nr:uncharacterized protein B0H18DRAFT_1125448 [Neoantrodia serialis]KAH9914569.1 hypothetical protein B0H18DRAFT_1125448 [Neoantrodia serialis]